VALTAGSHIMIIALDLSAQTLPNSRKKAKNWQADCRCHM